MSTFLIKGAGTKAVATTYITFDGSNVPIGNYPSIAEVHRISSAGNSIEIWKKNRFNGNFTNFERNKSYAIYVSSGSQDFTIVSDGTETIPSQLVVKALGSTTTGTPNILVIPSRGFGSVPISQFDSRIKFIFSVEPGSTIARSYRPGANNRYTTFEPGRGYLWYALGSGDIIIPNSQAVTPTPTITLGPTPPPTATRPPATPTPTATVGLPKVELTVVQSANVPVLIEVGDRNHGLGVVYTPLHPVRTTAGTSTYSVDVTTAYSSGRVPFRISNPGSSQTLGYYATGSIWAGAVDPSTPRRVPPQGETNSSIVVQTQTNSTPGQVDRVTIGLIVVGAPPPTPTPSATAPLPRVTLNVTNENGTGSLLVEASKLFPPSQNPADWSVIHPTNQAAGTRQYFVEVSSAYQGGKVAFRVRNMAGTPPTGAPTLNYIAQGFYVGSTSTPVTVAAGGTSTTLSTEGGTIVATSVSITLGARAAATPSPTSTPTPTPTVTLATNRVINFFLVSQGKPANVGLPVGDPATAIVEYNVEWANQTNPVWQAVNLVNNGVGVTTINVPNPPNSDGYIQFRVRNIKPGTGFRTGEGAWDPARRMVALNPNGSSNLFVQNTNPFTAVNAYMYLEWISAPPATPPPTPSRTPSSTPSPTPSRTPGPTATPSSTPNPTPTPTSAPVINVGVTQAANSPLVLEHYTGPVGPGSSLVTLLAATNEASAPQRVYNVNVTSQHTNNTVVFRISNTQTGNASGHPIFTYEAVGFDQGNTTGIATIAPGRNVILAASDIGGGLPKVVRLTFGRVPSPTATPSATPAPTPTPTVPPNRIWEFDNDEVVTFADDYIEVV